MTESWRPRLMTLGWTQFALLCAGLLVIGFAAWVVFAPALHLFDCEYRYLPSLEDRFGFHAERIDVPDAEHRFLAITSVQPGGWFDQAGFRAGEFRLTTMGG